MDIFEKCITNETDFYSQKIKNKKQWNNEIKEIKEQNNTSYFKSFKRKWQTKVLLKTNKKKNESKQKRTKRKKIKKS